eukprot:779676-Rhodomonas_salina.1
MATNTTRHALDANEMVITHHPADALVNAIRTAAPNSTIVLTPGRYTLDRTIVISQHGLRITSDSCHTAVICSNLAAAAEPMIRIEAKGVVLSNLTLEDQVQHEASKCVCVAIENTSDAQIENCNISAKFGTGIDAGAESTPTVVDCVVHNCVRGIVVRGNAKATVTGTTISSCLSSCVRLIESAGGSMRGNSFTHAGDACIWASGDATTTLIKNAIGESDGCG